MDKHLIGKWYKEELGETLNIFGEDTPRMKMSFSSSGYYNFEPNCVYEDGEELCFEINDEHYRMVYHVHYEDGDDMSSSSDILRKMQIEKLIRSKQVKRFSEAFLREPFEFSFS